MPQRIITYIDGYNLYHGLRDATKPNPKKPNALTWKRHYWINLFELSRSLLSKEHHLSTVKYFTARVSYPPDRVKRQTTFLEALATVNGIQIYEGQFKREDHVCRKCNATYKISHEKMTDVNIAVQMLEDAFQDNYEAALLISADSDLVPPVSAVKRLFPEKRIIVAFPPRRFSNELRNSVDAIRTIDERRLRKSLFPNQVVGKSGTILSNPWP
jgi:uncharacterized LabA/DUF88 family protein